MATRESLDSLFFSDGRILLISCKLITYLDLQMGHSYCVAARELDSLIFCTGADSVNQLLADNTLDSSNKLTRFIGTHSRSVSSRY